MKGQQSIQTYFSRQQGFTPQVSTMPGSDLGIVVVIPCFAEQELSRSLQSLAACQQPACGVEVLVVVNYSKCATEEEIALCQYNQLEVRRMAMHNTLSLAFYPIDKFALRCEHSGVGVARKYGMDEAAHRLMQADVPHGIIACYDADAVCSPNYLVALHQLFTTHKQLDACSIYYEHPLEGSDYPVHIYQGIARYELHLRYYNQACRYAGLPFAYHTVGSSMACTAQAYARVGGMVRNQAGEDFYFMQKFIEQGKVCELNTTCVYPSPRISNRVPFGTGRTMLKMQQHDNYQLDTYNLEAFEVARHVVQCMQQLYKATRQQVDDAYQDLDPRFREHVPQDEFTKNILLANSNAASHPMFVRRVFTWFNAFRWMRLLNDAHERGTFSRVSIESQALQLLELHGINPASHTAKQLLYTYRRWEREGM